MTLAFRDVACERGGRLLFSGVAFALAAGGAAVVSGPNGAGKSSLIRVAAGLLTPYSGVVERDGRVALLADAAALDGERSVAAALAFWARLDRAAPGAMAAALDDVGLTAIGQVPVRLLSTGQRRRIAMARVVASGADVWLLDEPANGLDAAAVTRLEALIARHRERGGVAVVATHLAMAVTGAVCVELGAGE